MADTGFEREFLQTHNTYRNQHGAPPLTINRDLCQSAQKWAEHLLSIKTLKHSNGDCGENLYYAWSSKPKKLTGREAVDSWYSEIKDYRFNKPGFTSGTGHFTQVVWKDTKEVGYGVATDGSAIFVVGQYSPAGNITNPGYFAKNVLPPDSPVDLKTTTSGPVDGVGQALGGLILSNKISTPSGPAEKGLSGGKDTGFEREFLQTHNTYRNQHGAPPLTVNRNLCQSAQKWAEHMLSIKTLKHSNGDYGENLYYTWSSSPKTLTGREAVDSWYSEIKDYRFNKPGFTSGTGHFTQVVWKDTKEVGYGVATDGATIFVVAQYLPAGNIANPGYFEKNVLPAGSPVDLKPTTSDPASGARGPNIQPNKTPFSGKSENSQFSSQLLEAMNSYRQRHGVSPLSHCPTLSKEAQEWAAHLVSLNTLKNSKKGHGETMSYKWTSTLIAPTGQEVAEAWYKESAKYNFSTPTFQSGTGNFTQMVWKSSERAGVGQATDGKGLFITVGFYEPAGNITNPGYFQDNVKPAGK
ncbi:GLI pathogenesis-related 2 [Salminus brasiliensis]|uniref:GLI pathogenesis-related 2 n=1 Tax=Salminus brasiliensis TaxID=930266 RepID=UPI003B831690